MAFGEYQTSTSVESSAGRPSRGWNCENPVSRAACFHVGSPSVPSMAMSASWRGTWTVVWPAIPEYVPADVAAATAGAAGVAGTTVCAGDDVGSVRALGPGRGPGAASRGGAAATLIVERSATARGAGRPSTYTTGQFRTGR